MIEPPLRLRTPTENLILNLIDKQARLDDPRTVCDDLAERLNVDRAKIKRLYIEYLADHPRK